ncbi:sugar ABC transporter substrate-binding protein [Priestia abyssalis]|uniref:sugar ABC transporter substrate-binding protein n=1 Tax=Priestia abyssalis TaxID=1221450 RepID=UPI0009958191|nr:sugar ABC transporter substrate-binding protein [Priestia abyssalis]
MLKKKLLFLLMIVVFSAILIGFIFKSFIGEKPKVVVVLKELNTQYWEIVKAGAEKGFRDFDIDGKVIAPSHGSEEAVQDYMLENVLKEHPDVLVVSPVESPAVTSILQKFVENKIPVLLIDTNIPWENETSYIGTDNFNLGIKAGALLASLLQPGDEVALIGGDLKSPVFGERIKGAKFSLEAVGIKIATEKVELPNESLPVRTAMKTILQNHPDIKGLFATTDIMALNALEVIGEHERNMPVIGTDGITEMVESIEDGTLTGTVAQNPYDMGFISVENALKVMKGEKIEKTIDTGIDIIIEENAQERLDFLKKILK